MSADRSLTQKYTAARRANLWGAIVYELAHVAKTFLLLRLFPLPVFAAVAIFSSLISTSSKVADFGGSYLFSPFFGQLRKNREVFRVFITTVIIQQLPVLFLVLGIGGWRLSKLAIAGLPGGFVTVGLFCFLVFAECNLGIIRHLLNVALDNQALVRREVGWYVLYQVILWTALLSVRNDVWHLPILLTGMVLFQLINLFLIGQLGLRFYRCLPYGATDLAKIPSRNILSLRITQWLLRLCKEAYSTHVLVPFFYLTLGMKEAAIFYLTTVVINSMQSIVKMSIDYTAAGLFAQLDQGLHGGALRRIIRQLMVTVGSFTIILVTLAIAASLFAVPLTTTHLMVSAGYFVLCALDQFMLPYQQLYTASKWHVRYATIKGVELGCASAALACAMLFRLQPAAMLGVLVVLKVAGALAVIRLSHKRLPLLR